MVFLWVVGLLLLVNMSAKQLAAAQDNVVFTDEKAGAHIDRLTQKGIRLLLRWRANFRQRAAAVTSTLEQLENFFNSSVFLNMTAFVQSRLGNISQSLDTAEAALTALNLTMEPNQTTVAFMKTPFITTNVGGAYDSSNRAGGTFVVPRAGLYLVTYRDTVGQNIIQLMLNGNVTLASSLTDSNGYYGTPERQVLRWFNAGDEIFTTGSVVPPHFGARLLTTFHLMPEFE